MTSRSVHEQYRNAVVIAIRDSSAALFVTTLISIALHTLSPTVLAVFMLGVTLLVGVTRYYQHRPTVTSSKSARDSSG